MNINENDNYQVSRNIKASSFHLQTAAKHCNFQHNISRNTGDYGRDYFFFLTCVIFRVYVQVHFICKTGVKRYILVMVSLWHSLKNAKNVFGTLQETNFGPSVRTLFIM